MKRRYFRMTLAVGAAAALALTACAGGDAADNGENGEDRDVETSGVPFGASMEEYQAAFADVEPISLRIQTEGTEGTIGAAPREAYAAALEEWSDGKITLEIGFANAFVPNALEWDDAIADGRLDLGMYLPTYKPEVYPLYAGLGQAFASTPWSPAANYIIGGWVGELGNTDPYFDEIYAEGVVPLLPQIPLNNFSTLWCTEPLEDIGDFSGKQVSASGPAKVAQIEALSATPVAMPFTEQYEALQRGVITCALTSNGAVDAGGLPPLVPYYVMDERVAFENPLSSFGISRAVWESMPLVAQQLIFDRLDVYMEAEALNQSARILKTFNETADEGGGPNRLSDDAAAAVLQANEDMLAALPDDQRSAIQQAQEKWTEIVVDELGFPDDEPFTEWILAEGYEDLDLKSYIDRYFEEFMIEKRPGDA